MVQTTPSAGQDMENGLADAAGAGEGGTDWEPSTDICAQSGVKPLAGSCCKQGRLSPALGDGLGGGMGEGGSTGRGDVCL